MALSQIQPPADFAEAHELLISYSETMEKAYLGYSRAFDLAAKGDMTTSASTKAEAAKLFSAGEKSLSDALANLIKLQARYGIK